ncbi:hypothetical protein [Methylomonas sp. MK1]|uniref:hypothetical protein n=1 Tax=Methylomonas sp. MK1 TaxID=1131552 RepID=UPI0003A20607|nr:hypothetical protein [Methylomonas sp. MK1]
MRYSTKSAVVAAALATMLLIHVSESVGGEEPKPVKRFALTAKERLGSKAADNQRVNNCKVPLERRGGKIRPETCHWVNVLTPDRKFLINK